VTFVTLTRLDGRPIDINSDLIEAIWEIGPDDGFPPNAKTLVMVGELRQAVTESRDEIHRLLR
jgi:uncharacterized protein YlzI (FlbEa/FlbD family)